MTPEKFHSTHYNILSVGNLYEKHLSTSEMITFWAIVSLMESNTPDSLSMLINFLDAPRKGSFYSESFKGKCPKEFYVDLSPTGEDLLNELRLTQQKYPELFI